MASTEQQFYALLRSEHIKDHLLPHLSKSDLCAVRLASTACCNLVTKRIFTRIHINFTANTFTKPTRVAALGRIGHHVEHLTFHFAHSNATFLPPLVHPETGKEINFLYTPHTSMGSAMTRPKYGNSEFGDILMQQYPPLFHAATNVPSFIHAFAHLKNMRHLSVRCPGQSPEERYRRDIVDYALISLRIAVERAALSKLHKLSLTIHPSALNYLRHVTGFGSVPSAGRRWKQIRKLHLSIESWEFNGPSPGLDHLKIIDDYIRTLGPTLEKFAFTWIGDKGPCPIALFTDPLFAPPRASKKLFHEVTSPMSPLPSTPARPPIHLPKLRYMQIRNSEMYAQQLKSVISSHQGTVKEFDFENVSLADNGDWDDALSPVNDRSWSRSRQTFACSSQATLVASDVFDDLPSPSAAVEAASKELLDLDLGGLGFNDEERSIIEELTEEVTASREPELDRQSIASGSTARDSVMSFSTTLRKKKRVKHHRHTSSKSNNSHVSRSHQYSKEEAAWPYPVSPPRTPKKQSAPRKSFESIKSALSSSNRPASPRKSSPSPEPLLFLQPTVYVPPGKQPAGDSGISPVQRNIEQEETHRLFAEDADARADALAKAKEAVMSKLSREFSVKKSRTNEAVAACRLMASRDFSTYSRDFSICSREVLDDRITQSSMVLPFCLVR